MQQGSPPPPCCSAKACLFLLQQTASDNSSLGLPSYGAGRANALQNSSAPCNAIHASSMLAYQNGKQELRS